MGVAPSAFTDYFGVPYTYDIIFTMFDLRLYKELFHFGHPVSGGHEVASGGLLPQQF